MTRQEEQAIRGLAVLVGVVLAGVVAYHFAGWLGVAGVVIAYCIYRAS